MPNLVLPSMLEGQRRDRRVQLLFVLRGLVFGTSSALSLPLSYFALPILRWVALRCVAQCDIMAIYVYAVPTGSYGETRQVVAAEEDHVDRTPRP